MIATAIAFFAFLMWAYVAYRYAADEPETIIRPPIIQARGRGGHKHGSKHVKANAIKKEIK